MKKGLIVFLVFAVVLVIGLLITGVFGKAEANTATLKVNATNTTIIVRDDQDQVMSNDNGVLIIGNTYSVEVLPNEAYILKQLMLNSVSQLSNLENGKFSFVCNGKTTITAASITNPDVGDSTDDAQTYKSIKFSSCKEKLGNYVLTDIVLQVQDEDKNVLAELRVGDTYDFLVMGQKYYLDAYSTETEYRYVAFSTNSSGFTRYADFPEKFKVKWDLLVKINATNSTMFPNGFGIECVGAEGENFIDLVEGETYTISDNAPEGYKTIATLNNQPISLPYTFTYTSGLEFDFEIVEEEVEYTTITYQFSNIESITLSKRDGTGEEIHLDVSTGTASVQLELGTDYNYEIVATAEYVITSTIYNGSDSLHNPTPAISGHLTIVENGVYQINTQQSNAGIYLNLALPNNSNGYISYTIGIYDPESGSQVDTRSVVVTSQSAPTSVYVDLNAYAGYGLTFDAAWVANGTSNSEPLLIAFADNPDFVNTLYGNNIAANSFPVYNIIFDENSAAGAA